MNQLQHPRLLFASKADAWRLLNPTRNFDEFKSSSENFKNDASWIEAVALFDQEFRNWKTQIEIFNRLHPTYFEELNGPEFKLEKKKQRMKKMQPIFEMLLNAKRHENGTIRKMPIEHYRMVHMFLI